jgi:hypothetical protein
MPYKRLLVKVSKVERSGLEIYCKGVKVVLGVNRFVSFGQQLIKDFGSGLRGYCSDSFGCFKQFDLLKQRCRNCMRISIKLFMD